MSFRKWGDLPGFKASPFTRREGMAPVFACVSPLDGTTASFRRSWCPCPSPQVFEQTQERPGFDFPQKRKGGSRVQRLALTRGDLGAPAQQYPAPSHFPWGLAPPGPGPETPPVPALPSGSSQSPAGFSPPPPPGTSYNLTGFPQRYYQILKVIVPNLPGPRPWRLIQWGLKPTF